MVLSSPLDARRLLRDSLHIAAIVALWHLVALAAFVPGTDGSIRLAGLVMAGLYAVLRGVELGQTLESATAPTGVVDVVRDNLGIVVVAGLWFLLAQAIWLTLSVAPGIRGLGVLPGGMLLVTVLNWTGVGTVLLYAVAVGRARLTGDRFGGNDVVAHGPVDASPADD